MTMMTGIEGITAPRTPARAATAAASHVDILPAPPAPPGDDDDDDYLANRPLDPEDLEEDFARAAATEGPVFTTSRRSDGWTPDRQRGFLDYIAQGCNVSDAATLVGMSATSAYAFRKRAAGAAFAVGWHGALLLQRNRLADDLMARALKGNVDIVINPKGETIERHRHDNRLALAMLTRLDRIAAADLPDRTGDARAARLAAQDWDRYLDIIGADASPAQAGLFLSLRATEGEAAAIAPIVALARADLYRRTGAGHAGELSAYDLDPARRHEWTAADWARAEGCGLVTLAAPAPMPADGAAAGAADDARTSQLSQHSPVAEPGVWWCDDARDWRTAFPPPAGFDGREDGDYGDAAYERALDDAELDAVEAWQARELDARRGPEEAERARFFADLLAGNVAAEDATSANAPSSAAGRSAGDRAPEVAAGVRTGVGEGSAAAMTPPCSGAGRSPGEREPVVATAPACAGARAGLAEGAATPLPARAEAVGDRPLPVRAEMAGDRPLPVRAEQVGRPSKYHFDGTLAEAPYFVPRAKEAEEEGQPFDRLRANGGCGVNAGSPLGPDAGVNPASSDGAVAPPAGPALSADAASAAPLPA